MRRMRRLRHRKQVGQMRQMGRNKLVGQMKLLGAMILRLRPHRQPESLRQLDSDGNRPASPTMD